jgi:hypothetical protein
MKGSSIVTVELSYFTGSINVGHLEKSAARYISLHNARTHMHTHTVMLSQLMFH